MSLDLQLPVKRQYPSWFPLVLLLPIFSHWFSTFHGITNVSCFNLSLNYFEQFLNFPYIFVCNSSYLQSNISWKFAIIIGIKKLPYWSASNPSASSLRTVTASASSPRIVTQILSYTKQSWEVLSPWQAGTFKVLYVGRYHLLCIAKSTLQNFCRCLVVCFGECQVLYAPCRHPF